MSLCYTGDNVTAELNDKFELTLRHNDGQDVTNTIVMSEQSWNVVLKWLEDRVEERHAYANRLLSPHSVL